MSLSPYRLAIIGFGVVGQNLVKLINIKHKELEASYGVNFQIVSITTRTRGGLYHPDGLNLKQLSQVAKQNNLTNYPVTPGLITNWDAKQIAINSNAHALIEVSPTNLDNGQPAIDHCQLAMENGKSVSTANKGPLSLAFNKLAQLAHQKQVGFAFESTVMAGTPAIGGASLLKGNKILNIQGIFNGTTNYILTQMENGNTFEQALTQAQTLGYAEADPSNDVEGYDTAAKVVILANVLLGASLTLSQINITGITHLTPTDIQTAQKQGKRWKLIGTVERQDEQIVGRVAPQMLPITNPLANVTEANNAITYQTDLLGPITLVGAGAGGQETAAGILADIISLAKQYPPNN